MTESSFRSRCILFVAAESHLTQSGGGGTYSRSILTLIRNACADARLETLMLKPSPVAARLPHRLRQAYAAAKSIFSPWPSKCIFSLPSNAARLVEAEMDRLKPDLLVLNSGELLALLERLPSATPKVLVAHNVESVLMRAQAAKLGLRLPILRPLAQRDSRKMAKLETTGAKKIRNIISISTEDTEYFRKLDECMNVCTIFPTFHYPPFQPEAAVPRRPLRVGFMARMSWWPNREGADWFVAEVLQHLPAGTIKAHFFGGGSEAFAGRHPDLTAHGFVESMNDIWRNCDIMICPVFSGSGVNIKFAEALYNRMPVLATRVAGLGLPPIDDMAIMYKETAEEWREFLASDDALRLAEQRPSPKVSTLFSAERQTETLKEFFVQMMGIRLEKNAARTSALQ